MSVRFYEGESPFEQSPSSRDVDEQQTLDDPCAARDRFLKIQIRNPETHGTGINRYTDYAITMRTNIPHIKIKECTVRRRYKDFVWLKKELERECKILLPPLPEKVWKIGGGLFDQDIIEDRKKGLEAFLRITACHQLVQKEKSFLMFLQDPVMERN